MIVLTPPPKSCLRPLHVLYPSDRFRPSLAARARTSSHVASSGTGDSFSLRPTNLITRCIVLRVGTPGSEGERMAHQTLDGPLGRDRAGIGEKGDKTGSQPKEQVRGSVQLGVPRRSQGS
ncbi:hypothetical protein IE53DRAFT_17438 [Violaceomyces palustris]|uniref:Uncharacterized protein n=1 Tax=Violaceomyces palustris TaxID=1673888 RepID=A0ACD0P1W5_9BASI|nr:hypothetical protein IE53DRAFT_17438 [Violaceomyces palustris]